MKDLTSSEARTYLDRGSRFLDVRTPAEFAQGHVPGALNVPLHLPDGEGMAPNPEFKELALLVLRDCSSVVVGCRSGARSRIACELIESEYRGELLHLACGFEGKRDAFGRLSPGWRASEEVEFDATPGQTYDVLRLLLEKSPHRAS